MSVRSVEAWYLFMCVFFLSPLAAVSKGAKAKTNLEVPQLRKRLPTILKLARERLLLVVRAAMGAHVAALRERLVADVAVEGALACVAAFVCLCMSSQYLDLFVMRKKGGRGKVPLNFRAGRNADRSRERCRAGRG